MALSAPLPHLPLRRRPRRRLPQLLHRQVIVTSMVITTTATAAPAACGCVPLSSASPSPTPRACSSSSSHTIVAREPCTLWVLCGVTATPRAGVGATRLSPEGLTTRRRAVDGAPDHRIPFDEGPTGAPGGTTPGVTAISKIIAEGSVSWPWPLKTFLATLEQWGPITVTEFSSALAPKIEGEFSFVNDTGSLTCEFDSARLPPRPAWAEPRLEDGRDRSAGASCVEDTAPLSSLGVNP